MQKPRASMTRASRPIQMLFSIGLFIFLTLPSLLHGAAPADSSGSLVGRVSATRASTFDRSTARIPDLGVVTDVAADGTFRFDGLRAGSYLLEVRVPGQGIVAERVSIRAAEEVSVAVAVRAGNHSEEIVVSASALARRPLELASPTASLSGLQLDLRRESSLGETLAQEPGVNSTFYGPGASQPVIRGLSGRRIRILEGGIGTGDASAVSADHALTTEPFQADRIEILRGPGTLLYGSSAIGGIVNVIDERIPSFRGHGFYGDVEVRGRSGNDERQGSLRLGGGGDRWAWNLAVTSRETGDYEISGFAQVEEAGYGGEQEEGEHEEEENPFGIVPNSDIESQSGRVGATYFFGDRGFFGASVGGFETEYGLPGGHEHGEEHEEDGEHEEEGEHEGGGEHEEEAPVRLDLEQRRIDLHGQINRPFHGFEALKLRLGTTDYEHVEREGDELGTTYTNQLFETRLEFVQSQRGRHSGSLGVQFFADDLEAVGVEAFIPATETVQLAVFTLQEIEAGPLTWQIGARYESQDADPESEVSRSHQGLSGSLGLIWQMNRVFSLAASGARSVRLPAAEELFSDGLHVATRVFEIGDPNLDEEIALGLNVSLRAEAGRFSGALTYFRQDFSDFIYQAFIGQEREGFPVVVFTQEDATFSGFELQGRFDVFERDEHHVHVLVTGDLVDAELDRGGNIPRTPPRRLSVGVHYHRSPWNAAVELRWADAQDKVADNETPTEGFTHLNASLGYQWHLGRQVLDLLLRGSNLTDEEARSHTSFLKDVAPLPGRTLILSAKLRF